jgi:hypothetical protein
VLQRLRRLLGRAPADPALPAAPCPPADPPYGSWAPAAGWIPGRLARPITYLSQSDEALARLKQALPAGVDDVVAAATRTLRHEFNLLGSGWFVPRDPDRPPRGDYQPIDWYLDPVRSLRFPTGVHHKQWKLYEMRPGNADVKYPWELARCQHWVALGQAFRLTGDRRFATEIADQLDDFVEANPVGIGINWTCTMDVGLRAVNWVGALDLVRDASIDPAFWRRAFAALFDHGLFIKANLENTYEVTSNHFLSNVLGLWFLAALFDDLDAGRDWEAFARQALETEIDVQVLADGADFESSVPYHRLVTELFMGAARLADLRQQPLSAHYRSRIADMVTYLADVMRPDGLMPQSGDADDGRLHVCGGLGTTSPQDGRHLLGPAAAMFDRGDWLASGGAAASWEAAWWGFDVGQPPLPHLPPVRRLFPDAGHAVIRDGANYLLITNSIVGTKGFGNHKHNDQLSFEYHAGGAVIVDPGSYVYTSDPAARNLFRGTAYHNTLMIDGIEQNEFNPEWLFRTFEHAKAEHVEFVAEHDAARYRGRHVGYTRLAQGVTHERAFRFNARTGRLVIEDVLHGSGDHQLRWHFHLAPGVAAQPDGAAWRLTGAGVDVRVELPQGPQLSIDDAWYSPSYGTRVPCRALNLSTRTTVAGQRWTFTFEPQTRN